MGSLFKTAEGILVTVGVFSLGLFAFYGLSHVIATHSPAPISTLIDGYVKRTSAAGWSNT